MQKIGIIFGTRPEIIKMCPIIKELQKRKLDYFVIHTGQHYSFELDKVFFNDLQLDDPKYRLEIGSSGHGAMVGRMLIAIEGILEKEKPSCILVQGDTNSVLAGGLAAAKLGIKVGHVEAGLRSYDRAMPEELNRILVDHLSDFLFLPTENVSSNLLKENIDKSKMFIVGNTIVDAVLENISLARNSRSILIDLMLEKNKYALLTLHRPANVDDKKVLANIFRAIENLEKIGINNILFPIHPRTEKNVNIFSLVLPKNVKNIKPVGYLDMLVLMENANIIFTDSGGLQEEACILNTPCVTLRYNTERPETVDVGSNIVVGHDMNKIMEGAKIMLNKNISWVNPFGDGNAAKKIINIIDKN